MKKNLSLTKKLSLSERRPRITVVKLSLALILVCLPGPVQAATRFWNGNGPNNNWTNTLNWVGGVAPVAGDELIFQSNAVIDTTSLNNTNTFPTNTVFSSIIIQSGSTNYVLNENPIVFT